MKLLIVALYLILFTYVVGKTRYVREQAGSRHVTIGYGSREKTFYVTKEAAAYVIAFSMGTLYLLLAYAVHQLIYIIYGVMTLMNM